MTLTVNLSSNVSFGGVGTGSDSDSDGGGSAGGVAGGESTYDRLSSWDDATWILTSTFIIFTMQSGFGLLESGSVSKKNESNIMVKNIVDVVFGGLSYWMFGYGLSFGPKSLYGVVAVGDFFVTTSELELIGYKYSKFFFHASFASTATTIVSGAMAERANFNSYIVFSFVNTVIYALPAHWIWHEDGWLHQLGAVDYAGSGAVHLVGGVTSLVAAFLLGPRTGRFDSSCKHKFEQMGNPINAVLGLFMLWWGWLGFNCGSTYGVAGGKWKLAAKSAVTTINSSIAAGAVSFLVSFVIKRSFDISFITNGILGGLVSITAMCPLVSPAEALAVGGVGALIVIGAMQVVKWCHIDDPVGASAVHGCGGLWSLIAVGLFCASDPTEEQLVQTDGLLHNGGFFLLGVQCLYAVCCIVWTIVMTTLIMLPLKYTMGLRASFPTEVFGADLVEHAIHGSFDHNKGDIFDIDGNKFATIPKNATFDQLEDVHCRFLLHNMTCSLRKKSRCANTQDLLMQIEAMQPEHLMQNGLNGASTDRMVVGPGSTVANGVDRALRRLQGNYPSSEHIEGSSHQSLSLVISGQNSPTVQIRNLNNVANLDAEEEMVVTTKF